MPDLILPPIIHSHIETNTACFEMIIDNDLIYFPDHFQSKPIIPGFAIIDWVMSLSQKHLLIQLTQNFTMEVIKFKQLIQPVTTITIHIKVHNNKLHFNVISKLHEHCSGRILISKQPEKQHEIP